MDRGRFEAEAERYDEARPPYPAALWRTLDARGLLQAGSRALDLGAGSGQATGPLLAAGLEVTAVEPGPRLAALLAAAHPATHLVRSRAEDLDLPDASYDLAVAATAIHWMALDVLLPLLHRLLVPGGHLAVWRNVFGDPRTSTPFRDRVAEIVAARDAPRRPGPDPEDVAVTAESLARGGLFAIRDISTYRWDVELDERRVGLLFGTFSDWTPAEVTRATDAVRELGGRVVEHYTSWLVVASRVD